ncbi:hypothetical protein POM88_052573 [Heracleum sosnowskyi]|uniref:Uncharacterized protein n=1 Tax=Heracleum sosnowskyi TaxID=360622 RepID=A0AAD8GRW3_9APIA|nr:hypothetical protein POM88_052573 [Heracleum sosnowskyi]
MIVNLGHRGGSRIDGGSMSRRGNERDHEPHLRSDDLYDASSEDSEEDDQYDDANASGNNDYEAGDHDGEDGGGSDIEGEGGDTDTDDGDDISYSKRGFSLGAYADVPQNPHPIRMAKKVIDNPTASRTLLALMRIYWPAGCVCTLDIDRCHPHWWRFIRKKFFDILKETGEEPGEYHLFLKMNTDKNGVCASGEVGVMMERYIQLCEKENVDPNNAPIQTWAKAVGVRKNSIVGVPRTKASDIIPIERSRKRRRRRKDEESGASTNGRPSVLHMADDFLIHAVDQTVAYASAHPEEFGLAPEQVSMFTKSVSMAEGEGELPSNHPLSMRTMTELVQVMLSVLTDIQACQQPDKNNGKGKSVLRDDDCPGSDDDDIRHPPHSPLADQCENGLD